MLKGLPPREGIWVVPDRAMVPLADFESCPEGVDEGLTIVVIKMGGPKDGDTVTTIVLPAATVDVTVLLVILWGDAGVEVVLEEEAELAWVRAFECSVDWKSDEKGEILVFVLGAVGPNTDVVVLETGKKGPELEGIGLDASGITADDRVTPEPVPAVGVVGPSGTNTGEDHEEAVTPMPLPRSLWSKCYG
jgi:hypothetical protein